MDSDKSVCSGSEQGKIQLLKQRDTDENASMNGGLSGRVGNPPEPKSMEMAHFFQFSRRSYAVNS